MKRFMKTVTDQMNSTLEYYEHNANAFADDTFSVSFTEPHDGFMELIPEGGYILDFGCGSGRDTAFFLSRGYEVDAVDGSAALCEIASRNTGIDVKNKLFSELDEDEVYGR